MPKKTTILIIILLLFTIGLIYIAIQTEQQVPPEIEEEPVSEEEALTMIPTIEPRTDISFNPATLNTTEVNQSSYSADISINTNGQNISGVQLELSYDPEIINNVSINPSDDNIFGSNPSVLVNSVDQDLGRASYAIALGINDNEISGAGNIATISFTVNNAAQMNSSQISILPKTTVRTLKSTNSLLRTSEPLEIILSSTTQNQNNTLPTATPIPQNQPL